MNEEEIINKVEEIIEYSKLSTNIGFVDQTDKVNAIQGLLDLYNKEREKNEELRKPKYIIDCKTNKITKLTNDFVSKDKVRELIQDIDETIYITKSDEVKFYMLGFKNSIQELLEERN